ncbi:hypothetical protein N0824_00302 [Microcystis sp. 0824]|nr:hypothetical protein N0824_00302 [Microcystis sp. 0824]
MSNIGLGDRRQESGVSQERGDRFWGFGGLGFWGFSSISPLPPQRID